MGGIKTDVTPHNGLWNGAIIVLVQPSSGGKLLGSNLYQELRLKGKNSYRSRNGPSRGMPVVENADKRTEKIRVDRHVGNRSMAQELKMENKTI
ncbi:hypothetical protein TNCV_4909281 [Trichonephila clavipes]|uniref:Uncharacterized protein n=1 Tax=Trichonephila clavipes TaxID=2585209 RepID=A0A8X6RPP7_TRICX|nr:hypothetical protein TNCV_4909281 [Trichonephila clavipes]